MSIDLVAGINELVETRARLAAEIETIDAQLERARAVLGVPAMLDRDDTLSEAVIAILSRNGPTTLQVLRAETGRSHHKISTVLRTLSDRVEVLGNTNRRFVRLRTDARPAPTYVEPERPARELASRGEPCVCANPACGKSFKPTGGTSGTFCSRSCYTTVQRNFKAETPAPAPPAATGTSTANESPKPEVPAAKPQTAKEITPPAQPSLDARREHVIQLAFTVAERYRHTMVALSGQFSDPFRARCTSCGAGFTVEKEPHGYAHDGTALERRCQSAAQAAAEPPPLRSKDVAKAKTPTPPAVTFPERRCGRCMKKFKPTSDREYVCSSCVTPTKVQPIEAPALETTWSGRRGERSISSYPTPDPDDHVADGPTKSSKEPSKSSLPVVEERDQAVLDLVRAARGGGRTSRELRNQRPEDSLGAIEAALTRLRLKQKVQVDQHGRWTTP